MPDSATKAIEELRAAISPGEHTSVLVLIAYLALGGLLAMYIRFLYSRATRSPVSTDAVARVFPMLTLVTTAVIAVVKSSLALSLGLVGALSIVRFRAAIKDPEELVYLFLCIAVGLALGAGQPLIAIGLVAMATLFIVVFDRFRQPHGEHEAHLTITGDATRFFGGDGDPGGPGGSALSAVRELCPRLTVQRCDVEGDEGQLRVQLHRLSGDAATDLVGKLRRRLPDCHVSYVNASVLA